MKVRIKFKRFKRNSILKIKVIKKITQLYFKKMPEIGV